jgi:hypothetical protein
LLLRASGESEGKTLDLRAITEGAKDQNSGIVHAAELTNFVEAALGTEPAALEAARAALLRVLGPAALVDSAAVLGNFERMTRIADGTGIPLDAPVQALTDDLRSSLDLGRFASAGHTPALGAFGRAAGRIGRLALPSLLRLIGRFGERAQRR